MCRGMFWPVTVYLPDLAHSFSGSVEVKDLCAATLYRPARLIRRVWNFLHTGAKEERSCTINCKTTHHPTTTTHREWPYNEMDICMVRTGQKERVWGGASLTRHA